MPIDTTERPRMAATAPACRAVVAARLHSPGREHRLLRALRVRNFAGEPLDEAATIAAACADAGLDAGELEVRREDGVRIAVPGFQPFAVYEVVLANLVPGLDRRDPPDTVQELLAWADAPLATREVAVVCEISTREARERLGRVARERHLGTDGLWSLAA